MNQDTDNILEFIQRPESLDPLLDQLETYLTEGAEKADFRVDRKALRSLVLDAAGRYEETVWAVEKAARNTLHELPAALRRVAQLIADKANYGDALTLFGAPPEWSSRDPHQPILDAIERKEAFLKTLVTLARKAPPPPPPRRRPGRGGRPRTSADLKDTVVFLAQEWWKLTGQPPTNDWYAGKPVSAAARFICGIVGFVAPERIGKVDKVLEEFIANLPQ